MIQREVVDIGTRRDRPVSVPIQSGVVGGGNLCLTECDGIGAVDIAVPIAIAEHPEKVVDCSIAKLVGSGDFGTRNG